MKSRSCFTHCCALARACSRSVVFSSVLQVRAGKRTMNKTLHLHMRESRAAWWLTEHISIHVLLNSTFHFSEVSVVLNKLKLNDLICLERERCGPVTRKNSFCCVTEELRTEVMQRLSSTVNNLHSLCKVLTFFFSNSPDVLNALMSRFLRDCHNSTTLFLYVYKSLSAFPSAAASLSAV